MAKRSLMKLVLLAAICVLGASVAAAQLRTVGSIAGVVQDPTGAVVVGAKVTAVDEVTGFTRETTTAEDGRFVLVDLPNATYRVTAVLQGFKTAVYPGVKVEVARVSNITISLEIGAVESTVVVEAGADVLQTTATAVESTVTGRLLRSLPLNNRDVLDFVMLMPGAQHGGSARQSTFLGLPKGAINITMDGLNIQDNLLKSAFGGGMFTLIRPKLDNVEEITVTSAAQGADSAGEGAVQVRFVTRRGTNDWHATGFWYFRSQWLNSNNWFNNARGLARPRNHLHQYGGNVGGPIFKDKLFFFLSFEDFKLPESRARENLYLTSEAQAGTFRYMGTDNVERTGNVLTIAGAAGYEPVIDSMVASWFTTINGVLANAAVTPYDRFRNRVNWNALAKQRRWFPTLRMDYQITSKIRWHGVANFNNFDSNPDTLNSMDPAYPGLTGGASQVSKRHSWAMGLNWEIRPTLNYELRTGRTSSLVRFFKESTIADLFPEGWRLFLPLSITGLHARPGTSTTSRSLPSFRDTPALQWGNNLGWVRGKHAFNFGSNLTVLTHWDASYGWAGIPWVTLGVVAADPVSGVFSTTTLPAASTTDLGNARALYALLTGRVNAIGGSRNVDEITKTYKQGEPLTVRNRQNELGFYFTDTWRAFSTLTLNYGVRWEYQGVTYNRNDIYTSPTYEHIWGKSGVGNLFKPGTLTGIASPVVEQRSKGLYDKYYKGWAPSLGFAWQPQFENAIWKAIFGGPGKAVFRGGYSIAYTREGLNHHTTFAGGSPGLTQSIYLNPGDPGFTPGGLLWRNRAAFPAMLESPSSFTFPAPMSRFTFANTLYTIDPNLRPGYVQSWRFSIQRELNPSTVLEIGYVGNHGTNLWRGLNINEINIFENGFLQEFINAQSNLAICTANRVACTGSATGALRFDNVGLAGQVNLPIFAAAFGALAPLPALSTSAGWASGSLVTLLQEGQAGAMANTLNGSGGVSTYLCRMVGNALQGCVDRNPGLVAGAYPANFFVVNPDLAGVGAWILTNGTHSTYNGLQVEVRRRMASGLFLTGNYTWSHSLSNLFADSATSSYSFTTLRDRKLDKGPSPWDNRHSMRVHWIYELPFGPGRKWSTNYSIINKMIEGWEFLGVVMLQSGRVFKLTSGRNTYSQYDSGVVLTGMTAEQLQNLRGVVKVPGKTFIYFISPSLIGTDGRSNATYLGPAKTPGVIEKYVYLYGPNFIKPDFTLAKKTRVTEKVTTEFRIEVFNAFNYMNFMVGAPGSAGITHSVMSTSFGQTTDYFNDLGNQDQGARMIQLVFRISF